MGTINLAGQWSALWAKIDQGDWSTLSQLLTWVGIILIVFAVAKWLWDKRRGQGGGMGGSTTVLYTAVIGGLLASPEIVIPVVLTVVDLLVNLVVRVLPGAGS